MVYGDHGRWSSGRGALDPPPDVVTLEPPNVSDTLANRHANPPRLLVAAAALETAAAAPGGARLAGGRLVPLATLARAAAGPGAAVSPVQPARATRALVPAAVERPGRLQADLSEA